jgi:hypothetical protein
MMIMRHPNFKDVYMAVRKRFYIKEKNVYKLRVIWTHARTGCELATETLIMSVEKYNEFTKDRL